MEIKVLGTGCAKCKKLYEQAEKAIKDSGQQVSLSKVERIADIMAYGVMSTPALVVNGEVKSTGRIPAPAEIVTWIATATDRS